MLIGWDTATNDSHTQSCRSHFQLCTYACMQLIYSCTMQCHSIIITSIFPMASNQLQLHVYLAVSCWTIQNLIQSMTVATARRRWDGELIRQLPVMQGIYNIFHCKVIEFPCMLYVFQPMPILLHVTIIIIIDTYIVYIYCAL